MADHRGVVCHKSNNYTVGARKLQKICLLGHGSENIQKRLRITGI